MSDTPFAPTARLDFLLCEPAELYHAKAKDYLSSHQLGEFRVNPSLYRKRQLNLLTEWDRPAFVIGRAAHTLILEGRDAYRRAYAFGGPTDPNTGRVVDARSKAFKDWAARQSKPALTDSQTALVEQMAASVLGHPIASELLADGVPERVLRADYCGVPCQARFDWVHPIRGLVDLKTCDRLDRLEGDARTYGYLHQLAFYHAILTQQLPLVAVHLIAVEKREPFRCGVWQVVPDVLAAARCENERAIEMLKQCHANDTWPTGYDELRTFDQLCL